MSIFGNNMFLYRDYLMLNEAYVGKTPTLQKIEEKIGEARKKITFYGANNTIKEIIEINRLFEKQFGMDVFGLHIYPSDIINGYTRVLGTNYDIAEQEVLHNCITGDTINGYRFKPNNNFCIQVYLATSLLMNDTFTDEEIIAIMLHEIGHNFADCIYEDIEVFNRKLIKEIKDISIAAVIMSAFMALISFGILIPQFLQALDNSPFGSALNNEKRRKNEKRDQSRPKRVSALLDGIKGKVDDISYFINGVISRLGGGASIKATHRKMEIAGVPDQVRKSIGRQNEVIADKFAGIYGYGPAQASSLLKMGQMHNAAYYFVKKIAPKANSSFERAILNITDFDCHPHEVQRAYEEIKLLEHELEKGDLDPKVRKVIEGQVREIKKLIKEYSETSEKFNEDDKAIRLYNAYVSKECPDAIDEEIEEKIEKALDDALNKNNKSGGKKK